jgi:hypothetical protein
MDRINLQRESRTSSPKERIAYANAKERKERGAENQAWRREEKISHGCGPACVDIGEVR